MNILIKLPIVLTENLVFSIFPKSRSAIEKYLFNPYAFNEEHIKYSQTQFEKFCQKIGGVSKILDKNILELGPGGSIGFGLLCIKNGAKKYYAIDDGEHTFLTEKQFDSYKKLLNNNESLIKKCFDDKNGKKSYNPYLIEFIAINQNSTYNLPDNSIDILYSCAVLEHVHNLEMCFSEMKRVLKIGGTMNHEVDFRDHIFSQKSLWFLRIKEFWFKGLFGKTGGYVNRKRISYYQKLIKENDLSIIDLNKIILFSGSLPKKLIDTFSKEDLETLVINITMRKN